MEPLVAIQAACSACVLTSSITVIMMLFSECSYLQNSSTTQFEVEYAAGGAFELLKAHRSDATCYVAFEEDGSPVDDACSVSSTDQRALLGLDFQ